MFWRGGGGRLFDVCVANSLLFESGEFFSWGAVSWKDAQSGPSSRDDSGKA